MASIDNAMTWEQREMRDLQRIQAFLKRDQSEIDATHLEQLAAERHMNDIYSDLRESYPISTQVVAPLVYPFMVLPTNLALGTINTVNTAYDTLF